MFLFIGISILALYGLLVFYIGWSGWRFMKPGPRLWLKLFYIVTLTVVASSFFLGFFFDNVLLSIIGGYWMAVFYLLIFLLPLIHICLFIIRFTRVPRHLAEKSAGWIALTLLIALISYGSYNAYSPVIRSYDIHIDKPAPTGMTQMKIAMAADMHFGVLSNKGHAERMVKEINAMNPDLVLFPGDIIDDEIDTYQSQRMDLILSRIESKLGVFVSLGNHDRHDGTMGELISLLEKSGMQVLYDEKAVIADGITLVGRKDYSDRQRASLEGLMADVDTTMPVILVDHQPYELDVAQELGIDLMVSGHTHRGQVFPGRFITKRIYENDWGYLQKEQLHSIVTSGFGFWGPPIRIGTRSEIVEINVAFAQ